MSKVLVIGCGGVASVAISKCCQVSDVFTELCIASRTKSKCDALAAKLAPTTRTKITTAQVDADDVQQLCDLINSYKPDLVMNIALPYQDLTIMDACLLRRKLYGHCQLRAGKHRRPRVACHLREALQGGRFLRLL